MANEHRRPGFALTAMEMRTLLVLAVLLLIGLIGKQVGRWNDADQTVVIQGTPPDAVELVAIVDSTTLPGVNGSRSVAPSTSPDVPSALRGVLTETDTRVEFETGGMDRSRNDSLPADDASATLDQDRVHPRMSDVSNDVNPISTVREGKFDLNSASSEDLESIPGIGSVLANRVLDWRDTHGSFKRVEDLLLIDGIGDKRLATMKQYVYVQPRN